eukprot:UN29230
MGNLIVGFAVDSFGGGRCLFAAFIINFVLLYFLLDLEKVGTLIQVANMLVITNSMVAPSLVLVAKRTGICEKLIYIIGLAFAVQKIYGDYIFQLVLNEQYLSIDGLVITLMVLCILAVIFSYFLFQNYWNTHFKTIKRIDLPHFVLSFRLSIISGHFWLVAFFSIITSCVVKSHRFFAALDASCGAGSEGVEQNLHLYLNMGILAGLLSVGYYFISLPGDRRRVYFIHPSLSVGLALYIYRFASTAQYNAVATLMGFTVAIHITWLPQHLFVKLIR